MECSRDNCFLHRSSTRGTAPPVRSRPREVGNGEVVVEEVAHRRPGVTASYTGESGFSFGVRGSQHLKALEKPEDKAFVKHISEYHKGEESKVKFNVEIVGHYSKPVERQVCEGVYVHSDQSDMVMNSKLEHHLPAVSRVTFSSSAVEGGRGRGRGRGRGEEGGQTPAGRDQAHENKNKLDFSYTRPNILAEPKNIFAYHNLLIVPLSLKLLCCDLVMFEL